MSSVELYLVVQRDMEAELALSKDYYSIGIEIYKCLTLSREHRRESRSYLDNKYTQYQSLTETSTLLSNRLKAVYLMAMMKKPRFRWEDKTPRITIQSNRG